MLRLGRPDAVPDSGADDGLNKEPDPGPLDGSCGPPPSGCSVDSTVPATPGAAANPTPAPRAD